MAAAGLSFASAGRRAGGVGGHGRLRLQRDRQLRQPALCVYNRTNGAVRVLLRGAVRRVLRVPAQENLRTLLPAGRYRLGVRAGSRWWVPPTRVVFRVGRRYHLEVTP